MTREDLVILTRALAPAIRDFVRKEVATLAHENTALRAQVAELSTDLATVRARLEVVDVTLPPQPTRVQ